MSVQDYASLYKTYSDMWGVPQNIIAAVVTAESNGNPQAGSSAGAHGLMQIIPETFSELAAKYNGGSGDAYDPSTNVKLGTAYLKELYTKYGTWEDALAAYNMGPYGYDEKGKNLNACPSETREYVPRVLSYAEQYGKGGAYPTDTPPGTVSTSDSGSSAGLGYTKGVNGAIPILKFAKFAQSLAFQKSLTEGFEQGMEDTLHGYLTHFMQKFYHNLFYVPTLPDNKAIVVKPETLFVNVPSCNVIYPTMKASIGFSRNPKSEPTRLIMISNHVSNLFGTAQDKLSQLVTMVFLDEKSTVSHGKTSYKQEVVGIGSRQNKNRPMNNLTDYEKRNGIRIMRESKGDDLYLFMLANADPKDNKSKKGSYVLSNDKTQAKGIGDTLEKLAAYTLLRARYETRPGNIHMYFNPYIVPGFPILSVEGSEKTSLNVYAYATDVTHSITESSWTTSVGFTATHIEDEPRPPNFPIAEDEYVETLSTTYKSMLGDCVRTIDNSTGAATCRAEYVASDKSVSSMLKKVWRPLTTRKQHLDEICDGATVVEAPAYTWFNSRDDVEKPFFNAEIQLMVKTYTQNIMDGNAFHEVDVR